MENIDLTNLEVSISFIVKIAKNYIKHFELEQYINHLYLNYPFEARVGSYYCYGNKKLVMHINYDINKIKHSDFYQLLEKTDKESATIYLYQNTLENLLHELEHVKQNKQVEVGDSNIKKILKISRDLSNNSLYTTFDQYHDSLPHERQAEIDMQFNIGKILNRWGRFNNPEIINTISCNYINMGGYVVSPIEQALDMVNKSHLIKEINTLDFDNYHKLLYGLPVEKQVIKKLYDKDIFKTDSKTIKKYIKSL